MNSWIFFAVVHVSDQPVFIKHNMDLYLVGVM